MNERPHNSFDIYKNNNNSNSNNNSNNNNPKDNLTEEFAAEFDSKAKNNVPKKNK